MQFGKLFLAIVFWVQLFNPSDQWNLNMEAKGASFFDHFDFFTGGDPTHGFVNYVDRGTAFSKKYVGTYNNDVYIGCDHEHVAWGRGRDSVKLTSKNAYDYGLFILHLSHMPAGCGTWPAYWTSGDRWPLHGEIDIIEGVDLQTADMTTLHTLRGCDFTHAPRDYSGYPHRQKNCDHSINGNAGCSISPNTPNSYGAPFNQAKGGLYAMEWTQNGIKTWFWSEGSIPPNAMSNYPNPNTWGTPYAHFPFGQFCPSSFFKNHRVIFDLTFCGDWDGSVFRSHCPGKGDCVNYVKNNPTAFSEAYWLIHWLKVFQ